MNRLSTSTNGISLNTRSDASHLPKRSNGLPAAGAPTVMPLLRAVISTIGDRQSPHLPLAPLPAPP